MSNPILFNLEWGKTGENEDYILYVNLPSSNKWIAGFVEESTVGPKCWTASSWLLAEWQEEEFPTQLEAMNWLENHIKEVVPMLKYGME